VRILIAGMLLSASAFAGEYAVLATGFRIHAVRHEMENGVVQLITENGTISLTAEQIVAFEAEPDAPKPTPAAAPVPAPAAIAEKKPLSARELVDEAARRNGLPPALVHSVAQIESAYRPDAVSPKGAIGIMQLMPATAAALQVDPYDPVQNVEAGARRLRELFLKYKDYPDQWRRALAAYNAGEGAVTKYNGTPPYAETQLYVEKVLGQYWKSQK
jgi:soluble lytic murein transglycosylase-like protein